MDYSEMGREVNSLIKWYAKDGFTAMRKYFNTGDEASAERANYAFGRAQHLTNMLNKRGVDWMWYWLFS